jgi:hypothetical protein
VTSPVAASIGSSVSPFPRALVRLCSRAQAELWGLRLGRLYGFGIGISYAAVAFFAPPSPGGAAALWVRCVTTASWVAGVGALSLARDLPARDSAQGLTSLSRLRGFGEAQLERARTVAGAIRLSSTVLVPGWILALGLLLRLRTLNGALLALALAALTVPYAMLVGGSLAPLARACSRWLPGRGRMLLLALTLGPWLLGSGLQLHVPSLPGAFSWLLDHIARGFR